MVKRFFYIAPNPLHYDVMLLVVRICIACFMLSHGLPKLAKLFGDEPLRFSDPLGVGTFLSLSLAVFAEVICSVCILLGLATRVAVLPLIVTMLVAALIVHGQDPFGKAEPALLYFLVYFILFFTGSGRYSFDRYVYRKF